MMRMSTGSLWYGPSMRKERNDMRRLIASLLALGIVTILATGSGAAVGHAQDTGAPAVASFRGSYNGFSKPEVLGPFPLHGGLVVVRARHGGTANFVVSLVTQDPGKTPEDSYENRYLLINSIGRYDGASAVLAKQDGDYYLLLSAGGTYDLRVEQPMPDNVTPVTTREFSGQHDQVTPVFALPAGTHRITATSTGNLNLILRMYQVDDLGGAAVSTEYDGRLINYPNVDAPAGPYNTTVTVDLPKDGLYLFHIYTTPQDARWTLRVE